MHYLKIQVLVYLLLLGSITYSQVDTAYKAPDTLAIEYFDVFNRAVPFQHEEPLILYIEMDLKEFYKIRHKEESVPAQMTALLNDSILTTKKIKIKPRGEFRRKYCSFPPVEIKFSKSDTDNIFTQEDNELKLVTHCKNATLFEQYVLKEYLCYKMYNLLTDYSFRVRLLKVHYIDSKGKKKDVIKYGFIVESNKSLAIRIDAYPVKVQGIQINQTDYDIVQIMSVFLYMIGDTDWAIPALHNVKLYRLKDPLKPNPLPVPYDFDVSGMVNTDYSPPDERLGIETVRQRVYRGYCIPEKDLTEVLDLFIQKKEEIYALVNNFELLDNYHKNEMLIYLDEFYDIIEKPYRVKANIIDQCRKL
jgi:hypothetical protein